MRTRIIGDRISPRLCFHIAGFLLLLSLLGGAASAQVPFACTGEAFIVQNINAELSQVDQSVSPFTFLGIGPPAGIEYNNLGFRRTDGLLYAVELTTGGNVQIIQVDSTGSVFGLGRPSGLPTGPRFDGGDIAPDGTTMYIATVNTDLYALDLTTVPVLPAVTSVPITGSTGFVFDYAVNPTNGLLYGGDSTQGQLAVLDPATGVRTDFSVGGCAPVTPDCTASALPSGTAFGGSWFNAAGRLFLYQNSGFIFEIDLSGPTIVRTQVGPSSSRNDAAACVQDVIGAAKSMSATMDGLPETVTIDYVVENLSGSEDLFSLTAIDDLTLTFGTHGVDWTFTSISSVPASFANPTFDGHTDTELVNQLPNQDLLAGSLATLRVELEVLNLDNLDADSQFCNQVLVTALTIGGNAIGDLSTDGSDPDPNADNSPDERDPTCVPFVATPAIQLVKNGTQDPTVVGDPGITEAGDEIDYIFQVTNIGDLTLTDVAVTDPMVSPISCPSGNPIPSLAVGASETCTGTYTVTQADVDAGHKDNTADATGTDPGGNPVSDQDSHSEPITQVPALDLVKTAAPATYDTVGQIIGYSYLVTNVGNVAIDNLTVADDNDDEPPGVSCPVTTLAPGASTTCTAQRTVTQADLDAGSITNTAIASGTDPGGSPVNSPPDSETVTSVVVNPAIQLIKNGALDVGGNGASNPGDLIDYTFEVTNTGDVSLTDVTVADPLVSTITCPSGNPIPSLAVGASETCTGSYAITQADIDAGQRDNTATVTGDDPGGNPVTDQDSHSEPIPAAVPQEVPCTGEAFIVQDVNAQLTQIDQSTSPFAFIDVGVPAGIEYNNMGFRRTDGLLYAVELNPGGNTQIIQIDRNGVVFGLGRPAGLPAGPRFDGGDVSTDGTTMYITTVNQDLYVLDLTTVPTLPPVSVVTISGATGFVFDWAYNPTNGLLYGGDSTSGELAVLDPVTGIRTDSDLIDTGLGTLPGGTAFGGAWFNASGQLFLYRNNGEIYEIDLSVPTIVDVQTGPGSIRNDGASCVQDVLGAAKRMTATADGLPETVTIGYVFENVSLVDDLFNLAATDDLTTSFGTHGVDWTFTSISSLPASFANPSFDGHLDTELVNQAPTQGLLSGTSATVTVTLEVLTFAALNVDSEFCNQILVTGETAAGTLFGDLSTEGLDPDPNGDGSPDERLLSCVGFTPPPDSMSLVKSLQSNADEDGSGDVTEGDTLTYGFAVTNTGASTLTSVTISDPLPGLSALSCSPAQPATLASAAVLSCTATYVVTAADAAAGVIDNTATASSDQTPDVQDSETVPVAGSPPGGPVPIPCTGEAYIVQDINAQLTQIDQSVSPFTFIDVGVPTGIEINNLAFRSTDGLLYAVELTTTGNNGLIQIDANGDVFSLGSPAGLPTTVRFDAGDVSDDGTTMYLNQSGGGTLYRVALPALTTTSVAVSGNTGLVFDWAYDPDNGLLYGGDSTGGELAILDPATGVRTDVNLVDTGNGTLPSGTAFGGAWFDATGRLFLYQNGGFIFEIDLSVPTIVNVQAGPGSTRNDAAACVQDAIGSAKRMSITNTGLPETVTIDYVFENFSAVNNLSIVSGIDDLSPVFGTFGVDWTLVSISSVPAGFHNPGFDGAGDPELINQAPTQNLAPLTTAMVTVRMQLFNFDHLVNGQFCNQVVVTALSANGVTVGDLSTAGSDPDPNGDGSPDERELACLDLVQVPAIQLVKIGALDLGGNGLADPGDLINYTFEVSNTGNVTLTGVTVSDPMVSPITCPSGNPIPLLAVGASETCTGSYAITQVDIDAGQKVNTATASGQDPGGNQVSDQDTHTEPIPSPAAIQLIKSGSLDLGGDGVATPGDLIHYTFQVFNTGAVTLMSILVTDPMVSPIDCGGVTTPPQIASLGVGASTTCTASYAITQADIDAGQKVNTATATGQDPGGNPISDQDTHVEPIGGQQRAFPCTGEAYIVQNVDAQLSQIDQSTDPFTFLPIGGPAGIEYNNLGFRSTDGLLYAVELNAGGNLQIVQIDATGAVTGLGRPAGLPTGPRFDAGDLASDGNTMFITTVNQALFLLDLTAVPALPAVTSVVVTGDGGFVFDWAYNPTDGLLYGGDSSDGQVAILDPATGVRTDVSLTDTGNGALPTGVAYGGAWFDASGRLFLYRNSGSIYEVDLSVPTVVEVRTGPGSTRNDAAACVQSFIGGAKQMTASGGGLPETVTIDYLFENFSATADLFNLSAIDNLVTVFGTQGVDWTFTSISSVPASFANPSFDGDADPELINQTPTQSLPAGSIATVQVQVEVLTLSNVNADGQFCNQALITAENAAGTVFGDQSTSGSDPDPNGDGSPDEREPACVTAGQSGFACTGEAYIVQNIDAELILVDQSVSPFVFIPVSGPTGIEINNLGLRRTDGLMYAVELTSSGNVQIIQIDAAGNVFGLGRPAGLPAGPRFDAGDVSSDGSTMYITSNNQDLYLLDLTTVPALPPVTTVNVSGSTGFVFDWAYNPADGLLYGGDSTSGQLAILDPASGVRSDVSLAGLPAGVAYGGAWFGTSGNLFLYRNSGTIFEVDLAGPAIVGSQTGPGSSRNDAASCVP